MDSRANINLTRHSPVHRSPRCTVANIRVHFKREEEGQEVIQTWILRATVHLSWPPLFTDLDYALAKADVDFKQEEEDETHVVIIFPRKS